MAVAHRIHQLLGSPGTVGVRAWDGSAVEPPRCRAVVDVRRPLALATAARAPGELGIARAYVEGDLDLTGDLEAVLELAFGPDRRTLRFTDLAGLVVAAGPGVWRALVRNHDAPTEEAHLDGRTHSTDRDRAAISHHYDVSNRFYELVLGPAMTYSCALFRSPDDTLEAAQAAKHELVCRKLGLAAGTRVLDVGCGWGSFLVHAARHHGAHGVGLTLSTEQAAWATARVRAEGLDDRIEIRRQDYRDLHGERFDAIASVGMFEHVGRAQLEHYVNALRDLLVPHGRLLNHAISRAATPQPSSPAGVVRGRLRNARTALGSDAYTRIESPFMRRYIFPDAELHEVGTTVAAVEQVGLEVRHSENLREHYALTLRRWRANLEAHWDEAVAEVGAARARAWRLYLAACALGFDHHATEIHQVLAVLPDRTGASGLPLRPSVAVASSSDADIDLRATPERRSTSASASTPPTT